MTTDETCQQFNRFLREKGEGTHFFRGNLHQCYVQRAADTQGRRVAAIEIDCDWRNGMLNRVVIEGPVGTGESDNFYLDERCF